MGTLVTIFIKGVIAGVALAAPVGPVGILCIHRTIRDGRASGFMTGLGAAAADMVYAVIATFGLTLVSDALDYFEWELRLIGAVLLAVIGVRIWFRRPVMGKQNAEARPRKEYLADFTSGFFITLTNPITLVAFMALMTGLELGDLGFDAWLACLFVVATFVGSNLWWFLLCHSVMCLGNRINEDLLSKISHVSAVVILLSSLAVLVSMLR